MNIAQILSTNYKGLEWAVYGNEYSTLKWLSDTPKPTEAELEAQWADVQRQNAYAAVEEARLRGYQKTSDPIMAQFLRGEKTEQEWLDAVQAVKDANPYPEAPIN